MRLEKLLRDKVASVAGQVKGPKPRPSIRIRGREGRRLSSRLDRHAIPVLAADARWGRSVT